MFVQKYLPLQKSEKQLELGGPSQSLKDHPVNSVLNLVVLFHCSVPWLCSELTPLKPGTYSGVNVRECNGETPLTSTAVK